MNRKPVLLVLGGGRLQKKIILQAEKQGIDVAVVDRDPNAPGKAFGSYVYEISTQDFEKNLLLSQKLGINGILTIGTDQPVLIAAKISNELGLPSFITTETALRVTNKEMMKLTLSKNNIPTARFTIVKNLDKKYIKEKIQSLKFPLVIKPVDSQGQRGVALVRSKGRILYYINKAMAYSKSGSVVIEEYCEGEEVTANAWIYNGKVYILALTDRVTYFNPPCIGVCIAHIFPSRNGKKNISKIKKILQRTVNAFHIKEGPLYVQILLTKKEPMIVELACRVGGGHEEDLIPLISGIDIRQYLIDFALNQQYKFDFYNFRYSLVEDHYGIFFIVAKGDDVVVDMKPLEVQVSDDNLICGEFYLENGSNVRKIKNATDRIGFFIVKGKNRTDLLRNAKQIYNRLSLQGRYYQNLIRDIFSMPLKGI